MRRLRVGKGYCCWGWSCSGCHRLVLCILLGCQHRHQACNGWNIRPLDILWFRYTPFLLSHWRCTCCCHSSWRQYRFLPPYSSSRWAEERSKKSALPLLHSTPWYEYPAKKDSSLEHLTNHEYGLGWSNRTCTGSLRHHQGITLKGWENVRWWFGSRSKWRILRFLCFLFWSGMRF